MKNNLRYIISACNYIGVWFISWSISHGFFSETRSFIMAFLWMVLFILWEFLNKKYIEKEKIWNFNIYIRIILTWLVFSIWIWMISGWVQHFLDSPTRSLWIIPLWFVISYLIYPKREEMKDIKWSLLIRSAIIFWLLLFSITYSLFKVIPTTWIWADEHHEESTWEHKE